MNWGSVAGVTIVLGGTLLAALGLWTVARHYMPEWAYYTVMVMAFIAFKWLGNHVDRVVTSYMRANDHEGR